MRSMFKGHFQESEATRRDLWKKAIFVFDANVLLNLYRYSDSAQKEFLRILTSIKGRSWLPEQCAYEFLENRISVISGQVRAYADVRKQLSEVKDTFSRSKGHPFISEEGFNKLESVIENLNKEISDRESNLKEMIGNDQILSELAEIFDEQVGERYSNDELSKLFTEGEKRYAERIPPGYKDGKKNPNASSVSERRSNFGDYILWRQTLDMAKGKSESVIFVTDDQKEDWWQISSGTTVGPRPELIAEFCEETAQKILIYTPDNFLRDAEPNLNQSISDETIDEIHSEHSSRNFLAELQKIGMQQEGDFGSEVDFEGLRNRKRYYWKLRDSIGERLNSIGREEPGVGIENQERLAVLRQRLEFELERISHERDMLSLQLDIAQNEGDEEKIRRISMEKTALNFQETEILMKLKYMSDD